MANTNLRRSTHPIDTDAGLLADIRTLARLWRQTGPLDKLAMKLCRAGKTAESDEVDARMDRLIRQACDLERRIAITPVFTVAGYNAKVAAIVAAGFDPEDLVEITWQLGQEAARLGITAPPILRSNSAAIADIISS